MTEASYDVLIIGAGPGGYPAAIRCGQLGLDVGRNLPQHRLHPK